MIDAVLRQTIDRALVEAKHLTGILHCLIDYLFCDFTDGFRHASFVAASNIRMPTRIADRINNYAPCRFLGIWCHRLIKGEANFTFLFALHRILQSLTRHFGSLLPLPRKI